MKKRPQLKTALLLAATVNVSYAAEVCFPPADGTPFYDVLQCLQDGHDAQQKRIAALEKENQRLANLVEAQRQEKAQLQKKVAELDKELTKFKKHHTLRYIDNGDGTVTDTRTELIWLKNANCFGRQNWQTAMQSAARLKSGQCGLRDGSSAGMWHLPTVDELKAMLDKRYTKPVFSNAAGTAQWQEGDAFSGVQSNVYWSCTEYAHNRGYAWRVNFTNGYVATYDKTTTYYYVWPVRRRQR
jgi:hypothetical protein